jgi:hypothetical protein
LDSSIKTLPLINVKSLCPQFSPVSSASLSKSEHFTIQILLQYGQISISIIAAIDSGAMPNFVDIKLSKANGPSLSQRINPAVAQTVDGSAISSGMVTPESKLKLTAANHSEIISFDAISAGHFPVILGIPWLNTHDPSIHWKSREILFSKFCSLKCLTSSPIVGALPINSLALKLNQSSHVGFVSSSPHDIQIVNASNFNDLISSGEQVFSCS